MAESEQISWAYVKLENEAEIFSAWIDSSNLLFITKNRIDEKFWTGLWTNKWMVVNGTNQSVF